ncbi:MAG: hypothetical protein AAB454_01660 [Patescibacteria group bacterium]
MNMNKYPLIRKIYLYSLALIGLILVVIGGVRLVSLGLKTYIFTKADIYYSYPSARPVKVAGDKTATEFIEPTKEELDEFNKNQASSNRQREAAESIAFMVVGLPLYLYHWTVIKKDRKEE